MSETTLHHIEHFTNTIGPRGSTTPQEAEAHDYCAATLEGLGYEVHRESFLSPTSGWGPYALAEGVLLVAVAIFWIMGRGLDAQTGGLAAAALALVLDVAFFMPISHRANPPLLFCPTQSSPTVFSVAR